jgi:hypothetical protein
MSMSQALSGAGFGVVKAPVAMRTPAAKPAKKWFQRPIVWIGAAAVALLAVKMLKGRKSPLGGTAA